MDTQQHITEDDEQPSEPSPDSPAPPPKPAGRKYSTRDLIIGFVAIVAVIVLAVVTTRWLAGAAANTSQPDDPAVNTPSGAGSVLVSGSGTEDEVSRDFRVPDGCNRQTLSYEAEQIDRDDGWVNFRVPYVAGKGGESLGPVEVAAAPTGSGLWTLTPGTYAIEVESWHARWSYKLACR